MLINALHSLLYPTVTSLQLQDLTSHSYLQHCSMQGLLFDENSYWVQQRLSEVSPLVLPYSRKIWRGIKFGGLVV